MKTASRTLVKSPPEVWEQLDHPGRMQGLMSALVGHAAEVTVYEREEESKLAWRASEEAWIEVKIAEKGWGTNVSVTAENGSEPTKLEGWLDAVIDELATPTKRPFEAMSESTPETPAPVEPVPTRIRSPRRRLSPSSPRSMSLSPWSPSPRSRRPRPKARPSLPLPRSPRRSAAASLASEKRVYVIELDRAAGRRRDPRIPWVYVGSSARSPEERFAQHLRGYKSARLAKRHALRLRPDLYEDLESFRGSKKACAAEKKRARELGDCGFVAHCDGTSYGLREGDWSEWDAERLAPVIEHVDTAVTELTESSFKPLDPLRCAQLLHGELGFWVAEYIDQLDPPPAYGLFSHVELSALASHLSAIDMTAPR